MSSGASAGFGRRLAALLYDWLLLAAVLVVFTGATLFLAHNHTHDQAIERRTVGAWFYLYQTCLLALIAGYYVLNWTRSGQTLGMRAWRLRAVTDMGKPMALKAAVLRLLFATLAWAPAALGVLWLYADPGHLALHDRLSKTRIIHLQRRRGAAAGSDSR